MKLTDYPLLVIVDDEQEILSAIKRSLMRQDVTIEAFSSPRLALEFLQDNEPDIIISDYKMPDITGLELLKKAKELWPECKRVMLSAYQEFDLVLIGFNQGIINKFISKPWKNVELQHLVTNLITHAPHSNQSSEQLSQFIGEHELMKKLFEDINKAADANVPIFICGETGTGKELVAKACHQTGSRNGGEFVAVNCANFSDNLIESQLFGHKKGAFTGAVSDQQGVFEYANGGTVFLDEITTLPMNLQSKLLRVIQERTYTPLGSMENKTFDIQVISASSTSLAEAVANGEFREDLYYRLSVIPINIPPLRERGADIQTLANHFLTIFSQQYKKKLKCFDEESLNFISRYQWPGNVRQLENVLHGLCVLNEGNTVSVQMLKALINDVALTSNSSHQDVKPTIQQNKIDKDNENQPIPPLHEIERKAIQKAINQCNGNVNKAAIMLEVNPSTLYRKIKQWS